MHVDKQFSTSIHIDETTTFKVWVHFMPVTMMQIYSNIFAEIGDEMLGISISSSKIMEWIDFNLEIKREIYSIYVIWYFSNQKA